MRSRARASAPAARAPREQQPRLARPAAPAAPRIGHDFSKVSVLQRDVSYDECTPDQERQIGGTHARAMAMVNNAFWQLVKTPLHPAVQRALELRFNSTNFIVQVNVGGVFAELRNQARSPQYECQTEQVGGRRGYSLWCVPFTDIELYPNWFNDPDIDMRAKTLIHEWCHRYICLFDFGYLTQDPEAIRHGTVRSLYNADAYAYFAYDIRNVT